MQPFYLSRHGQTASNRLHRKGAPQVSAYDGEQFQLTPYGRAQARVLGRFLAQKIDNPEDVLFLTSTFQRSIDTGRIVAEQLGVPFHPNNYQSPDLKEQLPLEWLPEGRESEFAQFDPMTREELGELVHNELAHIADSWGGPIIATLHGALNRAFQYFSGVPVPNGKVKGEGNCAVHVLGFDGGFTELEPFRYFSEVRAATKLIKNS